MSQLRETFAALPGARSIWHTLKSLPGRLRGLPAITYANLSSDVIRSCLNRPDPVIVDIGCNDGATAVWISEMFENPRLYCFEPDPRAAGRFKDRVGDREGFALFEMAVSDREGAIDFYQSGGRRDNEWIAEAMPQGWDLSGSIKQPHRHLKVHPSVTFENKIRVPTTTLDAICRQQDIGPVDLIWMDVQGAEQEVLRGAAETLARTRFVYTEYSDRELYKGQVGLHRLLEYLPGFSVLVRYPGDALLRNDRLV